MGLLSGLGKLVTPLIGPAATAIGAAYGQPQLGAAVGGALTGALSGGGKQGSTGTTSNLADFQKPYVQEGLSEAQRLFQTGGPQVFDQSRVAPLSQQTTNAIGAINDPSNAAAYQGIQSYLQGQQGRQFATNDYGLQSAANNAGNFQASQAGISNIGPATDNGLTAAAQAAGGLTAAQVAGADSGESAYANSVLAGNYLNKNPYLDATYERIARGVQSQADSQFASGGRLRSGAAQRALTSGLGDAATSLYGGNYEAERGRQGEAANLLQNRSGQLNQISMANAAAQNDLNKFGAQSQMDAARYLSGSQDQINALNAGAFNSNSQFNAGQTNAGRQFGISQQLDALGALGQRADQNAQFGANYGLNAAQGAGVAQDALQRLYGGQLAAGGILDTQNQNVLSDTANRFDAQQQRPFDNVANYLQNVGGNYGGSTTTSQTGGNGSTASRILGGAITGAGLYGQLFGGGGGQTAGGGGSGVFNLGTGQGSVAGDLGNLTQTAQLFNRTGLFG